MEQFKRPKENVKHLLKRYLQGQTTPEENERINHWYDQLPDKAHSGLPPGEKADLERSVLQHIHAATMPVRPVKRWLSYAAAILALAIAAGFLYKQSLQDMKPTIVETGTGDSRRVLLPDSSLVILNAGSTLTIDAAYGKFKRNITLEGEAFFDVRPDAAHPFTVQYGPLTTVVLGTSFNIRAYPNEQTAKIAVASGSVKVLVNGDDSHSSLLAQHESLQYDAGTGNMVKGNEDPETIGQWQNKVLDFNGNTLAEIVAEISRQYPDSIRLYSTAADTARFNTSFRHEKINDILDVLTGLTGISYKKENGQIKIYSKSYVD